MNFLAHLYLSCDNEDLLLGNFIADFIKNKERSSYPPEVQKGIRLHREIDRYTDNHPEVRKGTKRLQPHYHKYAPVLIDILYDHLLCRNWERYSNQSLQSFSKDIYRLLNDRIAEMPLKLQQQLPRMIADNWLENYSHEAGMRFTFRMLDRRTRFPSDFSLTFDHFMKDYELYNAEFNHFFPEVIDYVKEFCIC